MTAALRDSELLSQAILSDALEDYQQVRDAQALRMLSVTERIASWDFSTNCTRGRSTLRYCRTAH